MLIKVKTFKLKLILTKEVKAYLYLPLKIPSLSLFHLIHSRHQRLFQCKTVNYFSMYKMQDCHFDHPKGISKQLLLLIRKSHRSQFVQQSCMREY
jgi:hypothetical protein